jgi:hypothetical protein
MSGSRTLVDLDVPRYSWMLTLTSPSKRTPFTVYPALRPDYSWDLSNPIRYPRFRPSVSEMFQQTAFAFGVLVDINAFYRYTNNSVCLSHSLVLKFHTQPPG